MALFAVLMCVNFASCSNDEIVTTDANEKCTVSLNLNGIVETTEVPLGRSTTDKTLYFIYAENINSSEFHASGLFDKTKDISLELIKGQEYTIYCWAIKNAETKLYKDEDGVYGHPFGAKLTNSFDYENVNIGNPYGLKLADGKTYYIANVEEFMNTKNGQYYKASKSESINIQLERLNAFGLEFNADELTEGTIELTISKKDNIDITHTSPIITITKDKKTISEIFTLGMSLQENFSSTKPFEATLNIKWFKDANSEGEILGTPTITFKKDVKTIVKFKEDKTPQIGISIGVTDEPLPNGTTYEVEGNNVKEGA